jgi:hypothetical protein
MRPRIPGPLFMLEGRPRSWTKRPRGAPWSRGGRTWPGPTASVLAAGALPHVASTPISDLFHAPGGSPQEQATLVLMWQATEGIFDALFGVGLLLVPIGFIALGVAMLGAPAFGKGFGRVSVVVGAVGVVAASVLLVDPLSPSAFVGVLSLIVFHLILGWRLYSLSRAP